MRKERVNYSRIAVSAAAIAVISAIGIKLGVQPWISGSIAAILGMFLGNAIFNRDGKH